MGTESPARPIGLAGEVQYLYQGNWFDTAVAATLMTLPVLILSAFLQRYLRETSLAGVMR